MFYAHDNFRNRVNINDAIEGNDYYCPCCHGKLILKKGLVNQWHFAHKTKVHCDDWYEMSEWHKRWQEQFPEQFREVVLAEDGEKHRADIKVGNLVIEFQKSPLKCQDFRKRSMFYGKNNNLVWVFNVMDKSIGDITKYPKNPYERLYEWKWAYKFGNLHIPSNVDLFFQIGENTIIAHMRNKYNKGFKYFIGIPFSKYDFMELLRDKYKKSKKLRKEKKVFEVSHEKKVFEVSYDKFHKFARENGYE